MNRSVARRCGFHVAQSISRILMSVRAGILLRISINPRYRATAVWFPFTSNLKWADAPGDVLFPAQMTGLPKDSVALVAQVVTLDKSMLTDRCGKLPAASLRWSSLGLTSCWAAEQEVAITDLVPTFSVTLRSDHARGERPKMKT